MSRWHDYEILVIKIFNNELVFVYYEFTYMALDAALPVQYVTQQSQLATNWRLEGLLA
jgi:hypothetical protein